METFTTEVDVEFENHTCEKIELKWKWEPELRNWGIKGLNVSVDDQVIKTSYINSWDQEEDVEIPVEFKIENPKIEYTQSDDHSGFTEHISPVMIEVWKDKVTVNF